jgi:hypothetical protein
MFQNLTALALGVVVFAIMIGVGLTVLNKFADTQATCATDYTYSASTDKCLNATGEDPTNPTNQEWTIPNALSSDLGVSGLAGWTSAIIALAVGLLFIGALMNKRSY